MKRGVLLLATLLAILGVAGLQIHLWGFDALLPRALILLGAIGVGGSLISLALSQWSAQQDLHLRMIDAPRNGTEQWLLDTVRSLADSANIATPRIGVFDSPEMNALSVGHHRNHAVLALSNGMLARMSPDDIQAVLAHETAHIANGDMVTLGLVQGVLNTFVFFPARLVDSLFAWTRKPELDQRPPQQWAVGPRPTFTQQQPIGPGPAFFITVILLEVVVGLLANLVVLWFSRRRELRADRIAAHFVGPHLMMGTLQRLRRSPPNLLPSRLPPTLALFGIAGMRNGLARVFLDNPLTLTHPPLDDRIAALRNAPSGPLNRYQCEMRRAIRGTPTCGNCIERRDCPRAP